MPAETEKQRDRQTREQNDGGERRDRESEGPSERSVISQDREGRRAELKTGGDRQADRELEKQTDRRKRHAERQRVRERHRQTVKETGGQRGRNRDGHSETDRGGKSQTE